MGRCLGYRKKYRRKRGLISGRDWKRRFGNRGRERGLDIE